MGELSAFQEVLDRQRAAVERAYQGDAEPYLAMFCTLGPVTLFGAMGPFRSGIDNVATALRVAAARYSDARDFSYEVLGLDIIGDLAYTVGYERCVVSLDGHPAAPIAMRVTHMYRRQNGVWMIAHRHADFASTA
jgi:ketosteroid isomerase-like protein